MMECPGCGHSFLAKSTSCPRCGGNAKAGDEMKKVMEEPDLKKGGIS